MTLKEKNVPALQPDSYASLQVVDLVADSFNEDRNELSFDTEGAADKYFEELDQLSQDILDAENKARLSRYGIEYSTAIPLKAAEIGAVAAPAPASLFLWATQKKIEYAKSFILSQIDESLERTSDALAASAAKVFVESTGQSADELFNDVPPEVAAGNIQKAAQALVNGYDGIGDRQKKILLGAAVSAMNKLVARKAVSAADKPMTAQEAEQATTKIDQSREAAKKILENEKKLSESGKELTDKQIKAEEEFKEKGDLSKDTRQSLISTATTVIEYAKLADDVVNAAEALGLDPKVGSAIKRVSGAVQGAATAAIGIATGNPVAIISGVASFVSSIFGRKKKGPNLAVYLNKIFKKLDEIEASVERIEVTQRQILDNQKIISLNQVKLAKMSGDIIKEIQKNRDFLIEISQGPIRLFEKDLAEAGLLGAAGRNYSIKLSYDDIYQRFWQFDGIRTMQALDQLETLFGARGFIHPVLRANSYLPSDTVTLEGGEDRDTLFQLSFGEGKDRTRELKRRIARLKALNAQRSLLTEGASLGQILFSYQNQGDRSDDGVAELDTHIIDPGVLIRLSKIAISSNSINELLFVDDRGNRRIMTVDELAVRPTSDKGFELLEVVSDLLDICIGQQLILSEEYYKLEFVLSSLRGEHSIEDSDKYLSYDPGLKKFWRLVLAYASSTKDGRLVDGRWMDQDQIDLSLFVIENPYFAYPSHPGDITPEGNWTDEQREEWSQLQESTKDQIKGRFPGKVADLMTFEVEALEAAFDPVPMEFGNIAYVSVEFLDNQFSVLGDGEFYAANQYCGTWSRAQNNGGIIDYLTMKGSEYPYDDIRNHFSDGAPYDFSDEDRAYYLRWDEFVRSRVSAPPSWSKWDMRQMEAANTPPDSTNFTEFEVFRSQDEVRFNLIVEQLVSLKAELNRALLTYNLHKGGQYDLKERLLKTILPV